MSVNGIMGRRNLWPLRERRGVCSDTSANAIFLGLLAARVRQCYKQYIAGALTSYLHHRDSSTFLLHNIESKPSSNETDRLDHSQYHISQCQSKGQHRVWDDSRHFSGVQMLVKATLQRCI